MLPDETIATRADESGYETEVINESQVARTEAAVTTTLDYFTDVRADLNKPHLARPDRITETIAHLQAHVTTSNHPNG